MDFSKFVSNEGRPLPVILLLDTSGSMSGEKISTLNAAVKDMIKDFKSERLIDVNLQVSIVTFGGSAQMHTELTNVNNLEFTDLHASGGTPLGGALRIAQDLINDKDKISSKGYKPTIVLVSDGMPNDSWQEPLDNFLVGKRTSKCERWALGIGQDADHTMLSKFLNDPEKKVFDASVAHEISKFFKMVTMSTIARSKSVDPNQSIDLKELEKQFKEDKPNFNFGL